MILLDTAGLLAYHGRREKQHELAVTLFESSGAKLTHGYVLSEFIALAHARKFPRGPVLAFVRRLLAHPQVEVVWVGRPLNDEAISLLESRPDKGYSLADAVSFVLMRRYGITEALTTDHHFVQEGFVRILEP